MASVNLGTNYICDVCGQIKNNGDGYPCGWVDVIISRKNNRDSWEQYLFCESCKPLEGYSNVKKPEQRKTVAIKIIEWLGVKP